MTDIRETLRGEMSIADFELLRGFLDEFFEFGRLEDGRAYCGCIRCGVDFEQEKTINDLIRHFKECHKDVRPEAADPDVDG